MAENAFHTPFYSDHTAKLFLTCHHARFAHDKRANSKKNRSNRPAAKQMRTSPLETLSSAAASQYFPITPPRPPAPLYLQPPNALHTATKPSSFPQFHELRRGQYSAANSRELRFIYCINPHRPHHTHTCRSGSFKTQGRFLSASSIASRAFFVPESDSLPRQLCTMDDWGAPFSLMLPTQRTQSKAA